MYKLYWSKGSGAMTPQALLEEVGAEYEKIVVDIHKNEHKSADFLSVNPMGQIPALVLPSFDKPGVVGQDNANGYGLHNMGDLVHEWCSDWYARDYYADSPTRNPAGPPTGHRRASRGGSWRHRVPVTRCSARSSIPPDREYTDYGFRVSST